MLNTVNIPLSGHQLASLVVSENGPQSLEISELQRGMDVCRIELDRGAVIRLAMLLSEAVHFHDRGLILTVGMVFEGRTAEQIARDREAAFQLPF